MFLLSDHGGESLRSSRAADKLLRVAARVRGRSKALQTKVGESVLNCLGSA
jgi:hypothetical protein